MKQVETFKGVFGCLYWGLEFRIGIDSTKYRLFGCRGIQNWKSPPIPTGIRLTLSPSSSMPSQTPPYSLELLLPPVPRVSLAPDVLSSLRRRGRAALSSFHRRGHAALSSLRQ